MGDTKVVTKLGNIYKKIIKGWQKLDKINFHHANGKLQIDASEFKSKNANK